MYGFQQNQVTLQDAFRFLPFTFPKLTDNNLKHVNLQNGKLWALTQRNEIIARADLNDLEGQPPPLIDETIIKRKNIKKMYVDGEGQHCILLAENELFYCNWNDNSLYQINTTREEGGAGGLPGNQGNSNFLAGQRPRAFRSVDIYHAGGLNFFELLLGTQDGQIFHAALEYSQHGLEVVEPFTSVIEIPDAKAILDIKIAHIQG